ncbi:MAG: Fic family protein [Deltaproteobacteria bacterium]|nr:Fic family protein [Deltaproteobacteria bacterium]
MARQIPTSEIETIVDAVRSRLKGASFSEIVSVCPGLPRRTLQARIKKLVDAGRLVRKGERRGARYFMPEEASGRVARPVVADTIPKIHEAGLFPPLSKAGEEILQLVSRPIFTRKPVGYDNTFLNEYSPNHTFYLSEAERRHLRQRGRGEARPAPAGTHARDILNRLLIDLSWNSSRLEGNTYSLLDTERLINFGRTAEGKNARDATMILNHKAAIEFLVENAGEIDFERITILNLHALLSTDLLPDPDAPGRLRRIPVSIGGSVFQPLAIPQLVEERFHEMLAKAAAIEDPFEQAFFVMAQLPYLQPFDDVNKRVSRLAANIPLIQRNLAPISFTDVPDDAYVLGMLGVYELKRVELLRDVFVWAYELSAAKYAAQRQTMGEPDPFRFRWRADLRAVVGDVIRQCMTRAEAQRHIMTRARDHVDEQERERFTGMAEAELLSVRESNFARYRVRLSEYYAWKHAWSG